MKPARETRKATAAARLSASLQRRGLHAVDLAAMAQVSAGKAARWTSPISGESMPTSDLSVLDRETFADVTGPDAEAHGFLLIDAPPVDAAVEDALDACADVMGEAADVAQACRTSWRDRKLTDEELDWIEKEAGQSARASLRMEAWARAEKRRRAVERVVPIDAARKVGSR